eukprot:12391-Heterococcus_DN1.PRE.2
MGTGIACFCYDHCNSKQDLAASDSVRRSKLLSHLARHRLQVLLLQQRNFNKVKLQENTLSIVTAKLISVVPCCCCLACSESALRLCRRQQTAHRSCALHCQQGSSLWRGSNTRDQCRQQTCNAASVHALYSGDSKLQNCKRSSCT